jgi:hypothetical protein
MLYANGKTKENLLRRFKGGYIVTSDIPSVCIALLLITIIQPSILNLPAFIFIIEMNASEI